MIRGHPENLGGSGKFGPSTAVRKILFSSLPPVLAFISQIYLRTLIIKCYIYDLHSRAITMLISTWVTLDHLQLINFFSKDRASNSKSNYCKYVSRSWYGDSYSSSELSKNCCCFSYGMYNCNCYWLLTDIWQMNLEYWFFTFTPYYISFHQYNYRLLITGILMVLW